MAVRRPFRRGDEMVAIRAFHLDAERRLLPGDPLPEGLKLFQKRSLWKRRLIGAADCAWAQAAVAARAPQPEPDVLSDLEASESE